MRILLFGGTTEGRLLAERLYEDGFSLSVCVATDAGREAMADYKGEIRVGRLKEDQITDLLTDFDCVVDATHPYAEEITENIRSACKKEKVTHYRLLREESFENAPVFSDCEEVCEYLRGTEGNILLTTGSKELSFFIPLGAERLFVRILPDTEGITLCQRLGIPRRNIIAMYGPHTKEMNIATIRQYGIRYVVTKDGGRAGGFIEKEQAAEDCGADLCVIRRPDDQGLSMEGLWKELQEKRGSH